MSIIEKFYLLQYHKGHLFSVLACGACDKKYASFGGTHSKQSLVSMCDILKSCGAIFWRVVDAYNLRALDFVFSYVYGAREMDFTLYLRFSTIYTSAAISFGSQIHSSTIIYPNHDISTPLHIHTIIYSMHFSQPVNIRRSIVCSRLRRLWCRVTKIWDGILSKFQGIIRQLKLLSSTSQPDSTFFITQMSCIVVLEDKSNARHAKHISNQRDVR